MMSYSFGCDPRAPKRSKCLTQVRGAVYYPAISQRSIGSAAEGELDSWKLPREALFHFWEIKCTGKPLIKLAAPKDIRAPPRTRL